MEANAVSDAIVPDEVISPHRKNRRPPGQTQARIVALVNQGYSMHEIAAEIGISLQAVGQSMKRARKNKLLPEAPLSPLAELPVVSQGNGVYDMLAGVESQGLLKARQLILRHIEQVVPEMYRLLTEATAEDAQKVKMAEVWARIIFPTIKRTEHTGSGGAPLSILFKGINRGPETLEER